MKMQMRYFHCPVCHTIMTVPTLRNFKTEKYKGCRHRNNLYCPICKKEQRFILDEAFQVRAV